jgi:hypothetical protein
MDPSSKLLECLKVSHSSLCVHVLHVSVIYVQSKKPNAGPSGRSV